MRRALALLVLVLAGGAGAGRRGGTRYAFYRDLPGARRGSDPGARRVWGGARAQWAGACALLDAQWSVRCSCGVLARRWALTAAHCLAPPGARVRYVRYGAADVAAAEGGAARVTDLYIHPQYRVVVSDTGRGPDVTLLQHDVGLVRTARDLPAAAWAWAGAALPGLGPGPGPVPGPRALRGRHVTVLGFGRSESSGGGVLCGARLALVRCARAAWAHCVCGAGAGAEAGLGSGSAGVCAGDSGGPVLLAGTQVGVTSLGPAECGAGIGAGVGAVSGHSVMTALGPYAAVINATLPGPEGGPGGGEGGGGMLRVPASRAATPASHPAAPTTAACATLLTLLLL